MTHPPTPPHGIQRRTLKYIVFAGNYREYRTWQLATGNGAEDSLFVASPTNLTSLKAGGDYHLVFVGTFHLRSDREEIMEAARERFPNTRFTDGEFSELTS